MSPKLICPKCGSNKISVGYTSPLYYRCRGCKTELHDANDKGIPILDSDRARRKRPLLYGDPVCSCCGHAPHPADECEFCKKEIPPEVQLKVGATPDDETE